MGVVVQQMLQDAELFHYSCSSYENKNLAVWKSSWVCICK